MESSGVDTGNIDLSKLTDRDKQELQSFITNETQVSLYIIYFRNHLNDTLHRKQESNNVSKDLFLIANRLLSVLNFVASKF
jgi:hypothetical protein